LLALIITGSKAQAGWEPPCTQPGWFPINFGLKDHAIFWSAPYYYLISIYLPGEDRFAYARSLDLCNWETLPPVLSQRTAGTWDEYRVWAPFVLEREGVFYLYYTGVTKSYTQSILLATTRTPAEAASWKTQGMVFQPFHAGSLWQAGTWADCRDPHVIEVSGNYFLYYSGRDQAGGMIGLASAAAPAGPWQDQGAIMLDEKKMPESPNVFHYGQDYYLFYHPANDGEYYRVSRAPGGPWGEARPIMPGWAHEVWQSPDEDWFTSYLTNYTVSISSLSWDGSGQTPQPMINRESYTTYLPLTRR
jgi:predicted GH43/DUF377 family glycosyl hydrolase